MMYKNWLFGKDGALFRAAATGRSKLLEELIASGANVNITSLTGYTPLHRAAQKGHLACVSALLLHGADASRVSNDKERPVDMARKGGFTNIVSLLAAAK